MGGMGGGVATYNRTVVDAFHTALVHQGLAVLVIALAVISARNALRLVQSRRGVTTPTPTPTPATATAEAPGRQALRMGFGVLWVLDGLLQLQAAMPLGMVPQVIRPAEAGNPLWVHQLLSGPLAVWTYHPVTAAAAAVWIQLGIGLWLLVAPRGGWSRAAGAVSAGWGLLVWVFGEAFGGIFASGLSWLTGAPGGVIFYVAAGALVALPEAWWAGRRLGRLVLQATGVFFLGMTLLQAWPGRGYWVGTVHGQVTGSLAQMVAQMAQTPQPRLLAGWVTAFAGFDAGHGFAVNLFVVVALALIGAGLLVARGRVTAAAVAAGVVLCLSDWVLVQDLGFLGGVGTDPNSMLPMAVLFTGGYLALVRPAVAATRAVVPIGAGRRQPGWRRRLVVDPGYSLRAALALTSAGIVILGAAPMAAAATNRHADPVLAEAVDGSVQNGNFAAPAFDLVDQDGRTVSLASLRGKTVALTFLDDTCTSDCPLIAQEFRIADGYLGAEADHVAMVAINANPRYLTPDYLDAFDQQEDMGTVPNWRYLTGSLTSLQRVWHAYGEAVFYEPAGAMIGHGEYVWVINPSGRVRSVLNSEPGDDDGPSTSSFAALLASTIARVART